MVWNFVDSNKEVSYMDILIDIIKQFTIATVCFLFLLKIRPLELSIIKKVLLGVGYVIMTSSLFILFTYIFSLTEPYRTAAVIVIICIVASFVLKEKIDKILLLFIIVFALSYILFAISLIVSYVITKPFIPADATYDIVRTPVLCFIFIVSANLLGRIKVDFSPIFKKFVSGIFFSISSMVIILYGLMRVDFDVHFHRAVLLLISYIMLAFALISWLRRETTISKNESAKDVAYQKQQDILAQKERDIAVLRNISAYLTSDVHKKDKKLDGMKRAVEKIIIRSAQMDVLDDSRKILDEIDMSRNKDDKVYREKVLNGKELPQTGMVIVDGKFETAMESAMTKGIDFDLDVGEDLKGFDDIIPQFDIANIIGDLNENALTSIKHLGNAQPFLKIRFSIGKTENGYELSCEDSGISFDIETLLKLGVERVTSHPYDGGSGCGYETIFELLNEHNASLVITEYEQIPYAYSKKISILFDEKSDYIVKSFRADNIRKQNTNPNLTICDMKG